MPLDDLDLAIVDVETTGTASHYHRIIEIAVLRIQSGHLVDKYSTLLDPERAIPPFIETLTGIKNKDLKNAPTFRQVKNHIYNLLDGAIFVAHNAKFDYTFLREEFEREKINYTAKRLCTMRLSKTLFPGLKKHNLDSIIERFGIKCSDRHRAESDASALWDFLQRVKEQVDTENFRRILGKILKTPPPPPPPEDSLLKMLPQTNREYIFYDENSNPLYVNKSVNIRNRVLSHLSEDQESAREQALSRRVVDIQAIATSGELGALLLESHLMQQLSPLFNRKARVHKKLVALKRDLNEQKYGTIRLEHLNNLRPADLPNIVGIFKSTQRAKEFLWNIAKGYTLCPRILGIEKGKGECTYSQLQRCGGVCSGHESANTYNTRFNLAFAGRRMVPWPFRGPVLIEEKNVSGNGGEYFVVDNWCLLQYFRYDETGTKQCLLKGNGSFDYDGYKILRDYLLNSRKQTNVRPLTISEFTSILENEGQFKVVPRKIKQS